MVSKILKIKHGFWLHILAYSNQHLRLFSSILPCQKSYHSTVICFEEEFFKITWTVYHFCVCRWYIYSIWDRQVNVILNYSIVVTVVIRVAVTMNTTPGPGTGLSDLHALFQSICISTVWVNILLFSFYLCENWGLSEVKWLTKVTQLVNGRIGTGTIIWLRNFCFSLLLFSLVTTFENYEKSQLFTTIIIMLYTFWKHLYVHFVISPTFLPWIALKDINGIPQYTSVETGVLKGHSFRHLTNISWLPTVGPGTVRKPVPVLLPRSQGRGARPRPRIPDSCARIFLLSVTYFKEITWKFQHQGKLKALTNII